MQYTNYSLTGDFAVREPEWHADAGAPPVVRKTAATLSAVLLGFIAAAAAVLLSGLTMKPLLLSLFVAGIIPLAAVTRQPKALLLCAWIMSLTYFRVSFPIPSMAGFQGFYVTVADATFLLLLILVIRNPSLKTSCRCSRSSHSLVLSAICAGLPYVSFLGAEE